MGDRGGRQARSPAITFSKNRHGRFRDSDAFRHVFETVVERCIKEGLVGGEGFAVDASLIAAAADNPEATISPSIMSPAVVMVGNLSVQSNQ